MKSDIIRITAQSICNVLNDLVGENSPEPEFRKAWQESNRSIAERYAAGEITEEEMKAEYASRKESLVTFAFLTFMNDDNEYSAAIKREIYDECRKAALAS